MTRRDSTIGTCETCRAERPLHMLYRIPNASTIERKPKLVCEPCRDKWMLKESTIGELLLGARKVQP